MLNRSVLTDLMTSHVLDGDETITDFEERPDGATVATEHRRFTVTYEPDRWAVGREPWLSDLVIATRDDVHVHGQPERFGFLIPTGAEEIFVNDADAVARLGANLLDGMHPVGYAELLVQFHPYSSATRNVLVATDDLREMFALADLPDVTPLELAHDGDAATLTFESCVRYRRPGTLALLDIYEWRVDVPAGGPAAWTSQLAVEGIVLR